MIDNLERTLRDDIHAASSISFAASNMVLTEVSGTRYTYYVNANGQYIRYETGGGTAVVAAHMKSVQVSDSDGLVVVRAILTDGEEVTVQCLLGGAMEQS